MAPHQQASLDAQMMMMSGDSSNEMITNLQVANAVVNGGGGNAQGNFTQGAQ